MCPLHPGTHTVTRTMPETPPAADLFGVIALLGGVLVLGFRHGFDWDHIAAITDITSSGVATETPLEHQHVQASVARSWVPQRRALVLGSLYALGHASVVAALGLAAIVAGAVLPDWVDPVAGRVVGLTLIGLGAWLVYTALRSARTGEPLRLRSRWMLVLDGMRVARDRVRGREPIAAEAPRSYGNGTSYGVGVIHGIGAETATQVLLIAALGGASGRELGVGLMLAFIIGLVLANTVIVVLAATGFAGLQERRRMATAVGLVAGMTSVAVGVIFVMGVDTALPDLVGLLGATDLD